MVKLHRIDSGFYTFFLPNENGGTDEYQVEPYNDNEAGYLSAYMWSVYDSRNRYVASYATLSDIRTSF